MSKLENEGLVPDPPEEGFIASMDAMKEWASKAQKYQLDDDFHRFLVGPDGDPAHRPGLGRRVAMLSTGYNFDGAQSPPVLRQGDAAPAAAEPLGEPEGLRPSPFPAPGGHTTGSPTPAPDRSPTELLRMALASFEGGVVTLGGLRDLIGKALAVLGWEGWRPRYRPRSLRSRPDVHGSSHTPCRSSMSC